jgi:hypothetical protein
MAIHDTGLNFGAGRGPFVAEIYSKNVLSFFRRASVVEGITNNDYYGEVSSFGDTVKILKEPEITVNSYTRGATLTPQTLTDTELTLVLDQANEFNFRVDDIESKLAHLNWQQLATSSGAYALKDAYDKDVLATMVANAGTTLDAGDFGGTGGTAVGLASNADGSAGEADPLNVFSRISRIFAEGNIPEENRFVVVAPDVLEVLGNTDSKFLSSDYNQGMSGLKNGLVIDMPLRGFKIYQSNNLPSGKIIAGHMSSTATATAITNTEVLRDQDTFADKVRGLHVYGRAVVRPECLVAVDYAIA